MKCGCFCFGRKELFLLLYVVRKCELRIGLGFLGVLDVLCCSVVGCDVVEIIAVEFPRIC